MSRFYPPPPDVDVESGSVAVMPSTRYKCSLLVVDDEPSVLALLAGQLAHEFDVITALSAESARQCLSERPIDIVLTDLHLSDDTGIHLLDWVHRTIPRAARVLLTGTARIEDAADAINNCRVHRLILKPWRSEDLLATLRSVARGLLLERSHEQLLDFRINLPDESLAHRPACQRLLTAAVRAISWSTSWPVFSSLGC